MNAALRKTGALFIKDLRDVIKNPTILLSCLFPIVFVLIQREVMPGGGGGGGVDGAGDVSGISQLLIANALCYSAGFIGSVAALNSIAEEKEKWTLRTLMLANVRAEQILFSKGLVALVLVTVINVVCLLLLGGEPAQAPGILLIGMLGALPIILISLIFGLAGRDQMTAGIFGLPILVIALAPLFGQYGGTVAQLARFSPTGGMVGMVNVLNGDGLFSQDALIPLVTTGVWIVVGFLVYALLFKRLTRDN